MMEFPFTFAKLEAELQAALDCGYQFCTCAEYVERKAAGRTDNVIVHRVDVDQSVSKADRLRQIFRRLGIPASFFVRLHAKDYNPVSFENYRIIKALIADGHELGYHSEIIDQAAIWDEDPADCLRRDLELMRVMYGVHVRGVASHGGSTGLNNLDFWKEHTPAEFGLLYEAYDTQPAFDLFNNSFYVSDSEWTRWKCYDRGKLRQDDRRGLAEHARDGHPLIYLLIHPDTYYDRHFYE